MITIFLFQWVTKWLTTLHRRHNFYEIKNKMAMVYLWRPNLGTSGQKRVGHISLLLPDQTYISFWPEDAWKSKSLFGVPSCAKTLQEDISHEGGEPDDEIAIPDNLIDLQAIKEFWIQQMKAKYSFFVTNCAVNCTTVKQALQRGCKFYISSLYAADPQYVFTQIKNGLQNMIN